MDEREAVDVLQGDENLPAEPLQPAQGEVRGVAALAIQPGELIEVLLEELCDNDEVLLEVKVVNEVKAALGVNVVGVSLDDPEQLYLINGLIKDVLVILDYLHAGQRVGVQVNALHCMGEGGGADVLQDAKPRSDDGVWLHRELLCLLKARPAALKHHAQGEGIVDCAVVLDRVEWVPGVWVPPRRARRLLHRARGGYLRRAKGGRVDVLPAKRWARRRSSQYRGHSPLRRRLPRGGAV
mmetsp:Transcript_110515/g.330636  ORF Transcript_110515/g.330636 Transcript_110515/m.330636 type:complete len:239 (+) Transcript_110515:886-1602(+)